MDIERVEADVHGDIFFQCMRARLDAPSALVTQLNAKLATKKAFANAPVRNFFKLASERFAPEVRQRMPETIFFGETQLRDDPLDSGFRHITEAVVLAELQSLGFTVVGQSHYLGPCVLENPGSNLQIPAGWRSSWVSYTFSGALVAPGATNNGAPPVPVRVGSRSGGYAGGRDATM